MTDINPRSHEYQEYRQAIRELCGQFDSKYWQDVDERAGYPDAFIKALTDAGWLAALIPEQYGGGGLNITEASVILEEINRSGANSGACHAQMYIMGTLLRHGSEAQKNRYLPGIASGQLRLQSFAVTEPTTGTDTTKTRTFATRKGDRYDNDALHHMKRQAMVMGTTIESIQVYELLRTIDLLRTLPNVDPARITITGKSEMGVNALYAALLDGKLQRVILHSPTVSHLDGPHYLGVLRYTDIPEVATLLADKVRAYGELPRGFSAARRCPSLTLCMQ
jgi:hypothetical protein